MENLSFILTSLQSGKSTKKGIDYYMAVIQDSKGNSSKCFITKVVFDKAKVYLFKDITQFVNMQYREKLKAYVPYLNIN